MFRSVCKQFSTTRFRIALAVMAVAMLAVTIAAAKDIFAPNRVYVRFTTFQYHALNQKADAAIAYPTGITGLDAMMAEYGISVLKPLCVHTAKSVKDPAFVKEGLDRYYMFRFDDQKKWIWDYNEMLRLSNRLRSVPGIEYSAPVMGCTIDYTPNDWSLGGRVMWGLDSMHCQQAWNTQRGRPSILAISIDTGVDYMHPDLTGAFQINSAEDLDLSGLPDSANTNGVDHDGNGYPNDVLGYNFVSHSYTEIAGASPAVGEQYARSNKPMDVYGHGTHTFGSIASRTDNGVGVPSASFNIKSLGVKAGFAYLSGTTLGATLFFDDCVAAVHYSVDMGARIISMSFGAAGINTAFRSLINYAYAHNVACFASAGNNGNTSLRYPAAFPHVMGVAATTTGNAKATFSTYGTWVMISGPGTGIWSTMAVNAYNPDPYAAWDGTSMSTPNVAAVGALVLSRNSNLSNDQLDTLLCATATNIDAQNASYIGMLGAGLVNAQAAVNAIGPSVITAIAPRPAEVWWHTQTKTIRWIAPDSIPNVRIELNRSYPSSTWEVLFASTPNDSQQAWAVSGDTTSTARIRILDAVHNAIGDTTRGDFAIYRPWVQVTAPSVADTLREGVPASVTWLSGGIDSVDIDFMRTYPGGTWERMATRIPNTGSWGWTVVGPASTTARVRVSKASDTTYSGINPNPIILLTPGITVLTPTNGFVTHLGMILRTTYGSTGTRYVNIDINRNYPSGTWENLATQATANGFYNWTVTGALSNNCRIRVINYNNTSMGDTTHGSFSIVPSAIRVLTPIGGEQWTDNRRYNITWDPMGFAAVNILLNRNYPGGNWDTLALNWPNLQGSTYNWRVPRYSVAYPNTRIRLVNTANATQYDESDTNFALLRPTVSVTYPANSDTVFNGLPVNITWQSLGIDSTVQVYISRNGLAGPWEFLGTAQDSNHFYRWTPNLPLTNNLRAKVRAIFDTSIVSISPNNNVITIGTMQVLSPNGGEQWGVGTNQTITWASNMHGTVKIELNRTYPSSQWETLYPNYDNIGVWQWVANGAGLHNRFRISYAGAPQFADTSNGDFIIGQGSNVLDHPDATPSEFVLYPAAPNPFNPGTQFQVSVPQAAHLTIGVYDVTGRQITTLADRTFAVGYYMLRWNGTDMQGRGVPTGLYFVRLSSERGWFATEKLMLMK